MVGTLVAAFTVSSLNLPAIAYAVGQDGLEDKLVEPAGGEHGQVDAAEVQGSYTAQVVYLDGSDVEITPSQGMATTRELRGGIIEENVAEIVGYEFVNARIGGVPVAFAGKDQVSGRVYYSVSANSGVVSVVPEGQSITLYYRLAEQKCDITYNVTGFAGASAHVSGPTAVKVGKSFQFKVEEKYGYAVKVSVDGRELPLDSPGGDLYTVSNVTSDCTVDVTYTANDTYDFVIPDSVRSSANAHGQLSNLSDKQNIEVGDDFTFSISTSDTNIDWPDYWLLDSLEINHQSIALPRSYEEDAYEDTTIDGGITVKVTLASVRDEDARKYFTYSVAVSGAKEDVELTFINFVGSGHKEIMPHFDSDAVTVQHVAEGYNSKPENTSNEKPVGSNKGNVTFYLAPKPGYEITKVTYDGDVISDWKDSFTVSNEIELVKHLEIETQTVDYSVQYSLGEVTEGDAPSDSDKYNIVNNPSIVVKGAPVSASDKVFMGWSADGGQTVYQQGDIVPLESVAGQGRTIIFTAVWAESVEEGTPVNLPIEVYLMDENGDYSYNQYLSTTEKAISGHTLSVPNPSAYLGEDAGKYSFVAEGSTTSVVAGEGSIKLYFALPELDLRFEGDTFAYDKTAHSIEATTTIADALIKYQQDDSSWSSKAPTFVNAGDYTVRARVEKSGYVTIEKAATLRITPAKLTVKVNDAKKFVNDDDPEFSGTIVGTVYEGDQVAVTYYRAPAFEDVESVGTYPDAITAKMSDSTGNYYLAGVEAGDLTILPEDALLLKAQDEYHEYDANPHYFDSCTAYYRGEVGKSVEILYSLDGGETWSKEPPVRTDAGTTAFLVKAVSGTLESDSAEASLTVTPAPLTVRTANAEKVYDGMPLEHADGSIEGLRGNDSAILKVNGQLTDAGSMSNGCTVVWGQDTKAENYAVAYDLGTLTVKRAQLFITTEEDFKAYDGTPLKNEKYTVTGLVKDESVEIETTGSQTDAGKSPNEFKIDWVTAKEGNYELQSQLGMLTVEKAKLTITTGSSSKVYDGKDLTNSEIEVVGLVNSETVTAKASGLQKNVGKSPNGYTLIWGDTNSANYAIETNLGTLEVTPATVTVKIHDAEKVQGQDDPEFTYTVSGGVNGEVPALSNTGLTRSEGEDPGTYKIYATDDFKLIDNPEGNFLAENYILVVEPGMLTIKGPEPEPTPEPEPEPTPEPEPEPTPEPDPDNPDTPDTPDTPDAPDTPDTPDTPTPTPTPTPVTPGDGGGTTGGGATGGGTTPGGTTPTGTTGTPGTGITTTTTGDGDTPDADETPAPVEEETIADDDTPLASGETIEDDETPLTNAEHRSCWVHWVMVVGLVASAIYFVGAVIHRKKFTDDLKDFEDALNNNRNA